MKKLQTLMTTLLLACSLSNFAQDIDPQSLVGEYTVVKKQYNIEVYDKIEGYHFSLNYQYSILEPKVALYFQMKKQPW